MRLTKDQDESFPFDVALLAAERALHDEAWLDILDELKIESLDLPRVRFEQYDDLRFQWAAIVLELIRGGLHKERARALAAITIILKSQGIGNLADALAALTRSEQFGEATDHYLPELWRQLSDAKEVEQAQVVSALNNALRRQSSGGTELGVWRALALPEKFFDLVITARS